MPVDRLQLERELRLKLRDDGEIKRKGREFAEHVRDTWIAIWEMMGPHPYESGDYADSIEVHGEGKPTSFGRDARGRFTGKNVYAHYRVGTNHPHAHFIEYGTGPDAPGTNSPFGPYTPTPEFAPAGHTAAYYHGTGPD